MMEFIRDLYARARPASVKVLQLVEQKTASRLAKRQRPRVPILDGARPRV